VNLTEGHRLGSYAYMERVRRKLADDLPELSTYFQAGGLVDAVVNQGLPAPLDIQVSDNNLAEGYGIARTIALQLKGSNLVSDVLIPQDIDYPGLELNIDREQASLLGLTPKNVMDNVITALTSDGMIAPSYWIDPKSGNNYMLTVQYFKEKNRFHDHVGFPEHSAARRNFLLLHTAAIGRQDRAHQHAYGSRPLSDPPRRRCLRDAQERGSQ